MRKRILSLTVVTFLLLFVFAVPVAAAENEAREEPVVVQRLTYIQFASTGLSITNNIAYVDVEMLGYSNVTKVEIEGALQKRVLGLVWSNVLTFSGTYKGNYGYGEIEVPVSSGTYRVIATYTAYSGTAKESVKGESPIKTN